MSHLWQKAIRTAAALTSTLLVHHIAVKLEIILDKEADITHQAFADQIEARLGSGEGDSAKGPDRKGWNKGRNLGDVRIICGGESGRHLPRRQVDWQLAEFCYSPIIQSRSTTPGYDLRFTAESSSDPIAHKGVLLVAVGMRHNGYCCNVGRTFIIDPTKVCHFPRHLAIFTKPVGDLFRSKRLSTICSSRFNLSY
jgi:nucleosome binding factor SPN SPT16 subunit